MLGGTGTRAKGTHERSRMGWVMQHRGQHLACAGHGAVLVAAVGPVPHRLTRAGCCSAAMPACLEGWELIRAECPGRGRGDARAAWAQAELGFRAAAVLEQRQGQMVAGLALPHLGVLGWAWRSWPCPQPCPDHRCCCLSGLWGRANPAQGSMPACVGWQEAPTVPCQCSPHVQGSQRYFHLLRGSAWP